MADKESPGAEKVSPPVAPPVAQNVSPVAPPVAKKVSPGAPPAVNPIDLTTVMKPFVNGAASSMLTTVLLHPIDLIKVRVQVGQGSATSVARTILNKEGLFAFYKGLSAGLLRQATYCTVRLGSFRAVGALVTEANEGKPLTMYQKVCCGLGATAVGAFAASPADLALIRMQAVNTVQLADRGNYSNAFSTLYRIRADNGFQGLWKGYLPTVAKSLSLNCGLLASYDWTAEHLDSLGYSHTDVVLGASAISGLFSAGVSMPFDFIKSQMQTMEAKGFMDCAMKTMKAGGPLKFYTGFSVYCFRITPHALFTWIFLNNGL